MSPDEQRPSTQDRRRARLAASLRENLKRRKAQSRARAAEAAPSDGPIERDHRAISGADGGIAAAGYGPDWIWARGTRGWIAYKFAAARR